MEKIIMEGLENYTSSEERDKRSTILNRLIASATQVVGLEGKTAEEVFNPENEEGRRALLKRLSDEQYCELISGINGILRGKDKEDWNMDGVGVTAVAHEVLGAHIFPNHKHKKEIVIKSWEGAKQMNTEDRDLEEIGMLLGAILVETHPFGDGNGRTSRLVYSMLKNGYSEKEVETILGEYGRDTLDTALSKKEIDILFERKHGRLNEGLNKYGVVFILASEDVDIPFGKLQFPEGIDEEIKENIIQGARNDDKVFISSVLHFLQSHPEIETSQFMKDFGERKVFLLQNILSILTKEQIEELERVYWDIKKEYTEDMIDIFVNPDKPEYKIQKDEKEIRLLDYFKQRIADGQMLY